MPMEAIARVRTETQAQISALMQLQVALLRGLMEAKVMDRSAVITLLARAQRELPDAADPAGRDLLRAIEEALPRR